MRVTKKNIGQKMYLIDNSYAVEIGSNQNKSLAGTANSKPKEVEIISAPIILMVNGSSSVFEKEFVIVRHEGVDNLVLNSFYESKEAMEESHERFLESIKSLRFYNF